MMRLNKLFLLLFTVFIATIPLAYCVGISPAGRTIDYEPGTKINLTDRVINRRDIPVDVKVTASGTLGDYIKIYTPMIKISAQSSGTIKYELTIPHDLPPGKNIGFIEALDGTDMGGGMFKIAVKIKGKLTIFVPYPGVYPGLSINVENINEDERLSFSIDISNQGTENITSSSLKVNIKNSNNKTINTKSFDNIFVKSKGSAKINDYFEPNTFSKGKYFLEAIYDWGNTTRETKSFFVGSYEIEITDYTKNLLHDQISPIDIKIKSLWNGPINDAYASIEINGREYNSVKKDFKALGSNTFTVYVDDKSFELNKTYNGKIKVNFGDIVHEEDAEFQVIEKKKEASEESPRKAKDSGQILSFITNTHLVIIIIVLILLNILVLFKNQIIEIFENKNNSKNSKKEKKR